MLQHAFDWTNSHLHTFRVGEQPYEAYDPELWDDWPGGPEKLDESEFRLCDLLHAKGDRLTNSYDFGDGWRHDVRVEKILPSTRKEPATCAAGRHTTPPEDFGGVPGYYNLVEAMADSRHTDHRDLLECLGELYILKRSISMSSTRVSNRSKFSLRYGMAVNVISITFSKCASKPQ